MGPARPTRPYARPTAARANFALGGRCRGKSEKALNAALLKEIKILSDDTLQPVFRIPFAMDSKEPAPSGPALTDDLAEPVVRILTTNVGDTGIEPVTSSV